MCVKVPAGHAGWVERDDARGGADREICGIVDEAADLDEIEEDGGVNGARSGGVVVDVGKGLEDLGRQLEPGAVKGRNVAPMPGGSRVSSAPSSVVHMGGKEIGQCATAMGIG